MAHDQRGHGRSTQSSDDMDTYAAVHGVVEIATCAMPLGVDWWW